MSEQKIDIDALRKIALDNPLAETTSLLRDLEIKESVDTAIKQLEPKASLSYISYSLLSLHGIDRICGLKRLIDTYVSLSNEYSKNKEVVDLFASIIKEWNLSPYIIVDTRSIEIQLSHYEDISNISELDEKLNILSSKLGNSRFHYNPPMYVIIIRENLDEMKSFIRLMKSYCIFHDIKLAVME